MGNLQNLIEKMSKTLRAFFCFSSLLKHSMFGAVFSPNQSRVRPNRELTRKLQIKVCFLRSSSSYKLAHISGAFALGTLLLFVKIPW